MVAQEHDTLAGGAGADQLDGGVGTDTADYSASDAAVAVYLDGTNILAVMQQGIRFPISRTLLAQPTMIR